jgi:hypothetical protein
MTPEDRNSGTKGDVHCRATAQYTRSCGKEYANKTRGIAGTDVFYSARAVGGDEKGTQCLGV